MLLMLQQQIRHNLTDIQFKKSCICQNYFKALRTVNTGADATMEVDLLLFGGLKYDLLLRMSVWIGIKAWAGSYAFAACFFRKTTKECFAATHRCFLKSNNALKTKAISPHTDLNDDSLVQPIKVTLSTTTLI